MDVWCCVEYDIGKWRSAPNRVGAGMPVRLGPKGEGPEETSGTSTELWVIHAVSCGAVPSGFNA